MFMKIVYILGMVIFVVSGITSAVASNIAEEPCLKKINLCLGLVQGLCAAYFCWRLEEEAGE